MMPLAPHISLPAIGHMTSITSSAASDNLSSSMSSKPKLAFSIDSIVGSRKSASSLSDRHIESDRLSPTRVISHNKSRHSPVNCVRTGRGSPPLMSDCSPQMGRQLSPPNRSAIYMSPMSTPSPLSMTNGSANSPYGMDPNRVNQLIGAQTPYSANQPPIGHTGHPLSHPLMMGPTHQMSLIPQPYHQAVAHYPWLFRSNPFANRYHGMQFDGGPSSLLLPPFRKPKRIRTAFSPSQLLELEKVFEKNQYVVGSERKQLARSLCLSETQIKVWFQNRRTKHKRQKLEDHENGNGKGSGSDIHKANSNCDKSGAETDIDEEEEEDEDIDMDDNEENDNNSNEMLMNSDFKRHQLWYQTMQSAHHSPPVSLAQTTAHVSLSSSSSTPKI